MNLRQAVQVVLEATYDTLHIAIRELDNALAADKWIPVSEPPEKEGYYLVSVGWPAETYQIQAYNSGGKHWFDKAGHPLDRVTHYQALPEPPEE